LPEAKAVAGKPAARSTRTTALRTDFSSSTTAITVQPPYEVTNLLGLFAPLWYWTFGLP
jgi:hypothetical protein